MFGSPWSFGALATPLRLRKEWRKNTPKQYAQRTHKHTHTHTNTHTHTQTHTRTHTNTHTTHKHTHTHTHKHTHTHTRTHNTQTHTHTHTHTQTHTHTHTHTWGIAHPLSSFYFFFVCCMFVCSLGCEPAQVSKWILKRKVTKVQTSVGDRIVPLTSSNLFTLLWVRKPCHSYEKAEKEETDRKGKEGREGKEKERKERLGKRERLMCTHFLGHLQRAFNQYFHVFHFFLRFRKFVCVFRNGHCAKKLSNVKFPLNVTLVLTEHPSLLCFSRLYSIPLVIFVVFRLNPLLALLGCTCL